jgi:hypothetical protein
MSNGVAFNPDGHLLASAGTDWAQELVLYDFLSRSYESLASRKR